MLKKGGKIDLNGKTWDGDVSVAGDVTIVDGSDDADGKLDGIVTVAEGGSVDVSGGIVDDGISGAGKVVVSGGTVNGGITGAGKIDVSGGTVNGGITGSGEIAVSGGTVNGGVVAKGEGAKATGKGGTVSGGIAVPGGATGTISGEHGHQRRPPCTEEALVVTGGHFEKDPSDNVADGYYADGDDTNGYDVKERKSLEATVITVADATYKGARRPSRRTVKVDDETLELGKDFVAVYATNDLVNADTYDVSIVAIGAWIGSAETTFTIARDAGSSRRLTRPSGAARPRHGDVRWIRQRLRGDEEAARTFSRRAASPTPYIPRPRAYSPTVPHGRGLRDCSASAHVAANYAFDYVDGTLTVVAGAVAAVDATEYDTIAEAVAAAGKTADGKVVTMLDDADAAVVLAFGDVLKIEHDGFDVQVGVADAVRYFVSSAEAEGVTTYTVQQLKADGLAISSSTTRAPTVVYNTGKAEDLAWDSDKAYCTVVTATDLKAARWDAISGTSKLHSVLGASADVKVEGLDTTSAVRFFRIAVTPFELTAGDSVKIPPPRGAATSRSPAPAPARPARAGAPLVTRHSSLVTRHSSLVTRHSSLVTRHSSLVTRHSSLVTRHSSSTRNGGDLGLDVRMDGETVVANQEQMCPDSWAGT